jgi:hypothetical protein
MERKNYMKCSAETFKDLMCKLNRIAPDARVQFESRVFHGAREEAEFDNHEFKNISKITIEFAGDTFPDRDEITIHLG